MKITYIILAHKNPTQLRRLILKLMEPWTRFYIHIDRNVEIDPFKKAISKNDKIFFLEENEREPGNWGNIGIVKGTLNAMDQVIKENKTGTCILLSGQDYPLVKNRDILSFFNSNPQICFMDVFPIPHKGWENKGLNRIHRYKIDKSKRRGHFMFLSSVFDEDFYRIETLGKLNFLRKTGNWAAIANIFRKRSHPKGIYPFGGSAYWALPIDKIRDILKFVKDYPEYLNYHQYTLSADELFFQSILMALKKIDGDMVIKPSLTYVNWRKKNGPPPVTFDSEDFEELKIAAKNFLFARKFDINLDEKILDKYDEELLKP